VSKPAIKIGSPELNAGAPSAVQKWLSAGSERVGARNAVLLVRQGDRNKLLAQVPRNRQPQQTIVKIADRALREKRVLVRAPSTPTSGATENLFAGFSLRIGGRPAAIVFQLQNVDSVSDDQLLNSIAKQVLRRAEDTAASAPQNQAVTSLSPDPATAPTPIPIPTPAPTLSNQPANPVLLEQSALIDSVALVLDQSDLGQTLHALSNGVARQLRCQRVCIGLCSGDRLQVDAVSGLVDFDAHSALMIDIALAMEETRDSGSTLSIPVATSNETAPQHHQSLAEQLKQPALLSVPLVDQERSIGVLLLERDRPFTDSERDQVERLSILVAPLLALKQMESMGFTQWMRRYVSRALKSVFGHRHLGLKLGMIVLALFLIGSSFYTKTYRVNADATIEASTRRAVVSSFPSFLTQVEKRAGDLVQRGDVLAHLDTEDLELERIKWVGEQEKLSREYRATLAQRDRSKVRVLSARRAQAQAQIDLVDSQISRAILRAPVDGVVVSGDLSQALGSPVERGELLFEVASLQDYRLVLHLDETDIGWVDANSVGQLRLRSLADQTFEFQVTAITPVSEASAGANRFRVEAELAEFPDSFRPGMEGVAKIDVEPRSLLWIWTHSTVQWVKMQVWKFGGLG